MKQRKEWRRRMAGKPWLAIFLVCAGACVTAQAAHERWLAAWSPSMTTGGPTFHDQTLRMVVHASTGGAAIRLHLSNRYGTTPLVLGQVAVAAQDRGANLIADSSHAVTFAGAGKITIPAGADVISDRIALPAGAEQNLLVSLYLPGLTGPATWHSDAFDTSYVSGAGNHVGDAEGAGYHPVGTSWYYLSGLDVLSGVSGTVVAFGDSITDGYKTPTGVYARWPDDLARRLARAGQPQGVVDAGIGGNRVLTDVPNAWQGIAGTTRFARDALGQAGVRTVIVMEGINDIGNDAGPDGAPLTADALIAGYRNLIAQAHRAGVRIIGGTLLPNKGATYHTLAHEAIRQACNQWIRSRGAFDGVVDFDKAMEDPANPSAMRADYDSGDHLHPNAAGMQAMANAVDLRLLEAK